MRDESFRVTLGYRSASRRWGPHDKRVTFWLARLTASDRSVVVNVRLSSEHREHCWRTADEAKGILDLPVLVQAIDKCRSKLLEERQRTDI